MGNGDIFANIGISILLLTIAIIFLTVIILTGSYFVKKYDLSYKV